VSRIAATHRSALLVLAVASVLVTTGLVVAGLQSIAVRTYALRIPDAGAVGTADASHRLCEGLIQGSSTTRGVEVFADAAAGSPTVAVTVLSGGRPIATGSRTAEPAGGEQRVGLDHPIPAHRPVEVCIGAAGGALTVLGAAAHTPDVIAHGGAPGTQFALVLTRPGTLLGSLSTAFERAAIFRPSWIGAWTFWLLVALLACTLPLAGIAITGALSDPEPDESSRARNGSS
jgi:hypothetical protein